MKKRFSKKAYFFLIDSILALGVLAIGAFLIFLAYVNVPSKEQPAILSEDIMDFFADNKIKDVNNPYAGLKGTLWETEGGPVGRCPGEVLTVNGDITLLQQVALFYKKSSVNICYLDIAEEFINQLAQKSIPQQYSFEFWIIDGLLSPILLYPDTELIAEKNAANVLLPSKKIVFGISDEDTGEILGPYTAEVLLWQ